MKLDNSSDIVYKILNPSGSPQVFSATTTTFREIFHSLYKERDDLVLDIVLNGNWAMAQFSNLSKHRIRIIRTISDNSVIRFLFPLKPRRLITPKDFEYAALVTAFHGSISELTFPQFIWEEISTNFVYLILISLLTYLTLHYVSVNSIDIYGNLIKSLNELLISVATLYLSIFILFTVSQNTSIIEDEYLFRKGLTHRFFKIDRYLAILIIIVFCFRRKWKTGHPMIV